MTICRRPIRLAAALLFLLPHGSGCAKVVSSSGANEICADPIETTRHELFFGLQLPDSSIISEQEFVAFIDEIVSPQFPSGLTILDAAGRYQLADGREIEEPSKVLLLVYPDDRSTGVKIRDIITQYRMRFGQQSVGWVRTEARGCF